MMPLVPVAVASSRLGSAEAAVAAPLPAAGDLRTASKSPIGGMSSSSSVATIHVGATKPDRKTSDADVRLRRLPDLVVVAFDVRSDDMRDADLALAASNVGTMVVNRSARSFSPPVGVVSLELQGVKRLLTEVGRETHVAYRFDADDAPRARHPLHDVENLKVFDAADSLANALRWPTNAYRELAYRLSGATEQNLARAGMVTIAAWVALIATVFIALVKFIGFYGDPSFYLSLTDFVRPDSALAGACAAAVDGVAWRQRAAEMVSLMLGTCVRGLLFAMMPLAGTPVREPIVTLVLFAANVASLAGVRLSWCVCAALVALCCWHTQWREWHRLISRVTVRHTLREISEIVVTHTHTRCRDWAAKELVCAHMKRLGKRVERHNCFGRDGAQVDTMVDDRNFVRGAKAVCICSLCRTGPASDQALVVTVDTVDSGRRLVAAYNRQRSVIGDGNGYAYFICVTRNAGELANAELAKRRKFESVVSAAPAAATVAAPKSAAASPNSNPTNLCSEASATDSRDASPRVDGDVKLDREQAEQRRKCELLMGVSPSVAAARSTGVGRGEEEDENEEEEEDGNGAEAESKSAVVRATWLLPDLVLEYSGEMAPFLESASGHLAQPLALAPTAVA